MGGEDRDMRFNNYLQKLEVIDRARQLSMENPTTAAEWREITTQAKDLQNEWNAYGSVACDVAYQRHSNPHDEMWEEYRSYVDEVFANAAQFFEDMKLNFQSRQDEKLRLVRAAEALLSHPDPSEAQRRSGELMEEWKGVGFCGDFEEQLWGEFKAARDKVRARADSAKTAAKARNSLAPIAGTNNPAEDFAYSAKKKIIAEAQTLVLSTDFRAANKRFNELHDLMKLGDAGAAREKQLWRQFLELKSAFRARRDGK